MIKLDSSRLIQIGFVSLRRKEVLCKPDKNMFRLNNCRHRFFFFVCCGEPCGYFWEGEGKEGLISEETYFNRVGSRILS